MNYSSPVADISYIKKIYELYLIFYIISSERQEVYVLRVIKDLMNWRKILNRTKIYHFEGYNK